MGNQDAPMAPAGWYPIDSGQPGERYWDGSKWTGELRGLPKIDAEEKHAPKKIKKIWFLVLGGIAAIVLVVSALTVFAKEPPFITTDSEACSEMSSAIGLVNAKNYGSVAGIPSGDYTIYKIFSNARATAGIDAFENTGNKAESEKLINEMTALASDSSTRESFDYALYRTRLHLEQVVAICAELGFPMENTAINFDIPEVAPAPAQDQPAQPSVSRVPEGYTDTGVGIAYMKVEGECDYARCVHYQVYAYASCPSGVYLEGNQVDANGVIYGMTNDANGGMNIGDVAIMTLRATSDAATAIKITDASCY